MGWTDNHIHRIFSEIHGTAAVLCVSGSILFFETVFLIPVD